MKCKTFVAGAVFSFFQTSKDESGKTVLHLGGYGPAKKRRFRTVRLNKKNPPEVLGGGAIRNAFVLADRKQLAKQKNGAPKKGFRGLLVRVLTRTGISSGGFGRWETLGGQVDLLIHAKGSGNGATWHDDIVFMGACSTIRVFGSGGEVWDLSSDGNCKLIVRAVKTDDVPKTVGKEEIPVPAEMPVQTTEKKAGMLASLWGMVSSR